MVEADDSNIGSRIKEQRKSLGLSLHELARRTELTPSFISQVERGLVSTSIHSLKRIAEALGVSIMFFLNDGPKLDPVIRSGKRPCLTLPDEDITFELVSPSSSRKMEVYIGRLESGKAYNAQSLREPTEESIYLLSGVLQVCLNTQEYTLYAGDSIFFEGVSLRRFVCVSEEESVWIASIAPPAL
jgi:transcriptional regulator with XRE-family HTH domain